jgi:hypothetical protein
MSDPHLYEAEIENLKAALADAILKNEEFESMVVAIKNILHWFEKEQRVVKIGPYSICESVTREKIWIRHESGEGGEMSLKSFEKIYNEWL